MQATTLMRVFAAGALVTTCAAAAYLQEPDGAGALSVAQASPQPQIAPVIDMGRMFDAARR
ncbi:hypothetical protein GTP44_15590 [Duganella sp. FT50W]|uniref:Uncharacterized protein n=1 Tax=Duganella lactea TaxID=2692173 RepID=A0A6L8MJN1_9BURK|nr:hypothetical protein [Duganella lactea]MYM83370.1 hypothetical protein [Duganella lactea]